MIDKNDFLVMKKKLETDEAARNTIADCARQILTMSKQVIYSLHREDMETAKKQYEAVCVKKTVLIALGKKSQKNAYGMYSAALQEFAEAACYYSFAVYKKIPTHIKLKLDHEDYLLGICDLTGELERKTVFSAIKGDYNTVVEIKNIVEEVYFEFLKLDLRNSELRKKSDSIKWNLKKIDEVLYDLKIKGKL
ncbi:MAG: hypothetical protein V1859_05765 [archaeon]